ncbi:MAG: host attachment protein [Parachlamydiaceae bacterium]|nr:host attachment protein [Parachlamydiaceae bacterium]
MSHTWIIVANSAFARIFESTKKNDLHEILHLSHPESRLKVSELVTERQGRGHESVGTRRSAMTPTTSPKEVEFAAFAKDLLQHLEASFHDGKFTKLYIAAGPHFLGLLREKISTSLSHILAGAIDKDLTHLEIKEIRGYLPDIL